MRKLAAFATIGLLAFASCNNDDDDNNNPTPVAPGDSTVILSGTLGNRNLSADTTYIIRGTVFVPSGATLTIPAGTTLMGDKATKGTLVISPGGKIMADGSETAPIVFTSRQEQGARDKGDWGGLVILGKAPVNQTNPSIEGISPAVNYGGTDAADNSGVLRYVRVEYAGIALTPNNETNGITFGGVGSGTVVEHVQVTYGGDDSFEWFGGTVNAKWIVAQGTWDDDFDCDFGFTGKIQYALAVRERFLADQSGSNGFEVDNDGSGSTATPKTAPVFSNVTIIGPRSDSSTSISANYQHGAHLRRNSALSLFNSVIAGFPYGINIDGNAARDNYNNGEAVLANNILLAPGRQAGSGQAAVTPFVGGAAGNAGTYFVQGSLNNMVMASNAIDYAGAGLATALFEAKASPYPADPNFSVSAGAMNSGADYTNTKLSDNFFDKTGAYRGAFGSTDWTNGWANFTPNTTVY